MAERTLIVSATDDEPSEGTFYVDTEERETPGWVTLIRLVYCPGGCQGGEVLAGGDLVACSTCAGRSVVPIGIGGAYLWLSRAEPVPGEPSLTYYVNELRDFYSAVMERGDDDG